MRKLQTDCERMIFTEDGRPFFFLADTAWMAFSNLSLAEWEEYTDYRSRQGFSALQISILPILNDTSVGASTALPFAMDVDGKMNFAARNDAYFDKAERMLEIAVGKGLVPALVVLWSNYVPTAWASERIGRISDMPESFLPEYATLVAQRFGRFSPIWLVSGDTAFESDTVERYYMTLLREMKRLCPDCLATMHLSPEGNVPPDIYGSGLLDFYMYQSGHWWEKRDYSHTLAKKFRGYPVKLPVVNGEPCYEGHGFGGQYARFGAREVRCAIWQSLLAGANAGVTYGAHGTWMFHHDGMRFTSEPFSGLPYVWRDAMRFEGAWDASFAKWLYENKGLQALLPAPELIDAPEAVIAAATPDKERIAIYLPYGREVLIHYDLGGYTSDLLLLDSRRWAKPRLRHGESETTLCLSGCNGDALLLLERSGK